MLVLLLKSLVLLLVLVLVLACKVLVLVLVLKSLVLVRVLALVLACKVLVLVLVLESLVLVLVAYWYLQLQSTCCQEENFLLLSRRCNKSLLCVILINRSNWLCFTTLCV